MQQAVVVGLVRADLAEPAHRGAVELQLVDRLAGADPAQLRRPVRREDEQRDRRMVGLADRGVVVGGCRPRGAEDRHRRAASPARRRARRRRPSARRRSPSPRSPAGARARPRAASSASRARPPPDAARSAPAPRRRRRRARCCGWSGPCGEPRGGAPATRPRRSRRRGPARRVGRAGRRAARTRPRRCVEAKRRWVARPWARLSPPIAAEVAERLGDLERRGDPDRAVEGAGHVGGQDLGDLQRLLGAADLGELDPGHREGAGVGDPLGVGAGRDALVGRQRDRRGRRQLARPPRPSRPAARRARSRRARSPPGLASPSPGPRRRWRRHGSAPAARALRGQPAPAPRRRPSPA